MAQAALRLSLHRMRPRAPEVGRALRGVRGVERGRGGAGGRRAAARGGRDGRGRAAVAARSAGRAPRRRRRRRWRAGAPGSPSSTSCWAAASCRARMILIGGEPGIGKSTLLLQAAARLEAGGPHGALRQRRGVARAAPAARRPARARTPGAVHVLGETRLEAILDAAAPIGADVLVLDSIQTVYTDSLESAPGNVGQVRECAGAADALRQGERAPRSSWWVTSPRAAASPGPRRWSTSSTRCSTSRARPRSTTACCAPPRTASARWTSSACSR